MARIRSIKPEFWTSEQVVSCSPNARLLFIGLWSFCDDQGVHPAELKRIKMEVFPGDPFTMKKVSGWINELLEAGLLREYEADDGRRYWSVTGWSKHQRIEKPTNKYPEPPPAENSRTPPGSLGDGSASAQRKVSGTSTPDRSGVEGNGLERSGVERMSACAERSDRSAPPQRLELPARVSLLDGSRIEITQDVVTRLKALHPGVDIEYGIAKFIRWVSAHKARRTSLNKALIHAPPWLYREIAGKRSLPESPTSVTDHMAALKAATRRKATG